MVYQEPKKRTIRLDDDVYEALRKLPESPNKFLRKVLSADEAFDEVVGVLENGIIRATRRSEVDEHIETVDVARRFVLRKDRKPLLKPKERK